MLESSFLCDTFSMAKPGKSARVPPDRSGKSIGIKGLADYLGLLGLYHFNEADDPPLYMFMAEKIVQTGWTLDPFLSRRVALYGGVDYLNAQFIAVGREYQLNAVDAGLASLMLFALIVGAVAPRGLRRRCRESRWGHSERRGKGGLHRQ